MAEKPPARTSRRERTPTHKVEAAKTAEDRPLCEVCRSRKAPAGCANCCQCCRELKEDCGMKSHAFQDDPVQSEMERDLMSDLSASLSPSSSSVLEPHADRAPDREETPPRQPSARQGVFTTVLEGG